MSVATTATAQQQPQPAVTVEGEFEAQWATVIAQAALAGELARRLWEQVVAGRMEFREFVEALAEHVTQGQAVAWALADANLADAISVAAGELVDPIGYDMPDFLPDVAAVQRAIVKDFIADKPDYVTTIPDEDGRRRVDDERRFDTADEFANRRWLQAYQRSHGLSLQAWGESGVVRGWQRITGTNPCAWCLTLAAGGTVRPWYHKISVHKPVDHCRAQPVFVPAEQIGHVWRATVKRRLQYANHMVQEWGWGIEDAWVDAHERIHGS